MAGRILALPMERECHSQGLREGHTIMDVNRRHLIGVSAAGVAGALAVSPDAARAAPVTYARGRGATPNGVVCSTLNQRCPQAIFKRRLRHKPL